MARPRLPLCLFAACLCVALEAAAVGARVESTWKPQRTTFSFVSHTTFYRCAELERRLRQVLLVLGAHEAMRFDWRACSSDIGMHVDISFMSPIEATRENISALSILDTRVQLIARMRGVDLSGAAELPRFPAAWQKVSLSHGRPLHLRSGDCELMEQVRRQLLPLLAMRDIPSRLACTQEGRSPGAPRLNVSVLMAIPQ